MKKTTLAQGALALSLALVLTGCGKDQTYFKELLSKANTKADLAKIQQELNESEMSDKNDIRLMIAEKILSDLTRKIPELSTVTDADRLSGDILAEMNSFKDIYQTQIEQALSSINDKKRALFQAMIDKSSSKDDIRRIDRDIDASVDFPAKSTIKVALSDKIVLLFSQALQGAISITDADYIEKEAAIALEPYKNLKKENQSTFLKNYYLRVLKLVLEDQGRRDKVDYIVKIYNDILNDGRLLTSDKNTLYSTVGLHIGTLVENEMKTQLEKEDKDLLKLKTIVQNYIADIERKKELLSVIEFERLKIEFKNVIKFDQLKNLSSRLDALSIEPKLKEQFMKDKLVRNKVREVMEFNISSAKSYEELKRFYKAINLMSVIPEEDKRAFERKVTDKVFTMIDLEN